MSQEYILTSDGELVHYKLTLPKKNFKYVAKVDLGKNTRYFYTVDEYKAYLEKSKTPVGTQTAHAPAAPEPAKKSTAVTQRTPLSSLIKIGEKVVKKVMETFAKKTLVEVAKKKVEAKEEKAKKVVSDLKKVFESAAEEQNKQKIKTAEEQKSKYEETSESGQKKMEEDYKKFLEEQSRHEALYSAIDEEIVKDPSASFSELHKKDRNCAKELDQAAANPMFALSKKGIISKDELLNNSPYELYPAACALAYDLRRRGYDVAASIYDSGYGQSADALEWANWYTNLSKEDITLVSLSEIIESPDMTELERVLGQAELRQLIDSKQSELPKEVAAKVMRSRIQDKFSNVPDSSYGHLMLSSGDNYSDLIWEKENGNIVLRDCYRNVSLTLDEITYEELLAVTFYRTDDKEIAKDALQRVRNRKTN